MNKKDVIYIIFVLVILLTPIIYAVTDTCIRYSSEEIIEIEIKEKYIKTENRSGTYFIIDKDNNAFEISDLLFKGKFNSTDLYNQLEVGKTYKVKTTGKRIHFLSMYKNINEIIEEEN